MKPDAGTASALRTAQKRVDKLNANLILAVADRDALIREAAQRKVSLRQIGICVGLSTTRIAQILDAKETAARP